MTNTTFQQSEPVRGGVKRPAWMEQPPKETLAPMMADGRKPGPVYRVKATKVTAQPMLADGDGGHWAKDAFPEAHKGGLHRALGVREGKKIPAGKMNAALHSKSSKIQHMAQAAKNI
jgi:hypothetical protein